MKAELIAIATAIASAAAAFSAPVIEESSVTAAQEAAGGGSLVVSYTLSGDPGIVTVDILTNGVSIGGEHIAYLSGDVNRLLAPGAHAFSWKPWKSWPGHRIVDGSLSVRVTAWATNAPPDYLVVDCEEPYGKRYYPAVEFLPGGVTNDLYKTARMVLRKIPAAGVEWRIGEGTNYLVNTDWQKCSPHYVTLSEDFYLGVYPLTQGQFERLTGTNPSSFGSEDDSPLRPLENCSYNSFRGATYHWPDDGHRVAGGNLSTVREKTAVEFDLPTETQWEFACRAGCGAQLYTGRDLDSSSGTSANLEPIAWYLGNSGNASHPVGLKDCNAFGLYDMIGNVWEFCLDNYAAFEEGAAPVTDPTGPQYDSTMKPVKRGGSYADSVISRCRAAQRHTENRGTVRTYNGFRLACPAVAW